jgi:hypothetical protein
MNQVTLTGIVAISELRRIESAGGRELLNLVIHVDGGRGESPRIKCAFFLRNGRPRQIEVGQRVLIVGSLKHRMDAGMFIAAQEISVIAADGSTNPASDVRSSDARSAAELPAVLSTLGTTTLADLVSSSEK